MPGARRKKKGQTGQAKSAQIRDGGVTPSGPDSYDDTANTNAGAPPDPDPHAGKGYVTTDKD